MTNFYSRASNDVKDKNWIGEPNKQQTGASQIRIYFAW